MTNVCTRCGLIVRSCFVDVYKLQHKGEGFYADYVPCVDKNCNGSIVEVDENILPIIKLLWNKGYNTNHCCSGHAYQADSNVVNETYISFRDSYTFQDIPLGFSYITTEDEINNIKRKSHTIRKTIESKNEYETMSELNYTMLLLYKWAESLPYY